MSTVSAGALTLCCADMDARPLFWTNAAGGRDGYEPAAARLVADRVGLALVWGYRRWDRFGHALAAREVDAIWCGSAITDERRRVFAYSRPYGAFDEAVLVRSDSPVRSSGDLRGCRVGAIAASTNMALAETFGASELIAFDGASDDVFAEMIDALRSGQIDAMVDDEPAFGGVLEAGGFRIAHVAETQNPWGAACRLGDAVTAGLIDRGLGEAIADGSLAREWSRWFPGKALPDVLRTEAAPVSGRRALPPD